MVNLGRQYAAIKDEVEQGIAATIAANSFVLGPNVAEFEKEAAAYLGVGHAVACASGTDALHLALRATGVCCGDEVITTATTFIASAEAIAYVGAKPVFVDIDRHSFNITGDAVAAAISRKTKAVLLVHLFGQPADLLAIRDLCDQHNIKLIEDCAQSFGARVAGQQTGSVGDAAGFSFFPSKNLGAFGDGGLITTNSDTTAAMLRKLCNHGSSQRYHHDYLGYNSRLDEIQAVVLRAKLKHLDDYNQARRRAAKQYDELLANLPLQTPFDAGFGEHVYHQYTIIYQHRDQLAQALQRQQLASAIYYPIPLHRQKVFQDQYSEVSLPNSEYVADHCLSLPICPALATDEIKKIAATIASQVA